MSVPVGSSVLLGREAKHREKRVFGILRCILWVDWSLDQFSKSCWMSKCSIWSTIPKYSIISYYLSHLIPLQCSSQRQLDKFLWLDNIICFVFLVVSASILYLLSLSFLNLAIYKHLAALCDRESHARMVSFVIWKCVPGFKTEIWRVFTSWYQLLSIFDKRAWWGRYLYLYQNLAL